MELRHRLTKSGRGSHDVDETEKMGEFVIAEFIGRPSKKCGLDFSSANKTNTQ